MARKLMKGNEAISEAAIIAGCRHFFGYPITPQNQIPEYMSRRMKEVDGVFIQAESEVSAINMVFGAAGAGARVMTSSSSPGISLKQEGISYLACAELPAVIVNIMRTGPGLGGILASQGDYFQAVKGGGHGDYKMIVLAPDSVQEAADLTMLAFDLADQYLTPVTVLGDGIIGQMMEPVDFSEPSGRKLPSKNWAAGMGNCPRAQINSMYIEPENMRATSDRLAKRYDEISKNEVMSESYLTEDADFIVTAFGTVARIAKTAIDAARADGIKVGLLRPITLWPWPDAEYKKLMGKPFLCVEMNSGQMREDVERSLFKQVEFLGVMGGFVPTPGDILDKIQKMGGTRQ